MNAIAPRRPFVASPLQTAFFEFMRNPRNGSAILVAVAGSGKTTTIVRALLELSEALYVTYLAFNTSAAKELNDRIARLREETGREFRRAMGKTFHSLGFGAVRKALESKGVTNVDTDGKKSIRILRETLGEAELELYGSFAAKLVSLAKGQGLGVLVADTLDAWRELVAHHDMYLESEDADEDRAIEIARALLRHSNERAKAGLIDFDDQLYLPLLWRLRLWQNDVVFVDEAQDTNPARRALAKLALKPGGRLIAVGDPRQAIYGFTGASNDAMDLIEREFNCQRLGLTVSYRCPKAVAAQVHDLVPYFEVADGAPEGEVRDMPVEEALKRFKPDEAVLCRNVAPMVDFAYGLIARGIGCNILGKEIGDGLTGLIKKQKAKGLDALQEKLEAWRDREVAKFVAKGQEGKAESITDKVSCIFTLVENLAADERSIPGLVRKIESLFTDDPRGTLTLASCHKAKGREWPNVYVLEPNLSPSKWARQDWQFEQEQNLVYVRDTRTMGGLYFLTGGLK